jgi:hypothetical protein
MSPSTKVSDESTLEIEALGKSKPISFEATFDKETEIAGHPTANLVVGVKKRADGTLPQDIDLFLTLRHIGPDGKEVFYTGEFGECQRLLVSFARPRS